MCTERLSDVTSIIVNWERPHETISCLESIQAADFDMTSVILVDNGSKDDSPKILPARFPHVQFLQLEENLGFTGGFNAGIALALENRSNFLFLLNNDTLIQRDTIAKLKADEADILVPKIRYLSDRERIWAAGAYWRTISATIKMRGNGKVDRGQFDDEVDLNYSTACAIMVHRIVFEKIGGFDERFINYFEDYDFCHRAIQSGFKIRYVPDSIVYHADAKSLDRSPGKRWWYIARNTVYFLEKHQQFSKFALARNMLWVLLREMVLMRLDRFRYYLRGYRAGLNDLKTIDLS